MANQTKDNIDLKEALIAYFFTIGVLAVDTIFNALFKGLGLIP